MTKPNPRILYISSANPLKGPGAIGMGHFKQIKEAGYDVDMLTLERVEGHPEILFVKEGNSLIDRIKNKFSRVFKKDLPNTKPYFFFYKKESCPPFPIKKILRKLSKKYNLVIVYFWQGLLSFRTIDAIYEKLGHPIVYFLSPDFSHMAGGCHFPGTCEKYQTGCGCCPVFNSSDENDFTHWNILYRKKIYEKIKPAVFGNSYMLSFYIKSFLLKDARIVIGQPVVDTDFYRPLIKQELRKVHKIANEFKFVIAFGCQNLNDPRKGINYLIEALHLFYNELTNAQISEVLLLIAGKNAQEIKHSLPFSSKDMGLIPVAKLSEFYSMADIFVCPSVNDAGPSMVSQSISCGTPVVGFEMGSLLDWVKGNGTGYCAKLRDSKDLAKGIMSFYEMSENQRLESSAKCRQFALNHSAETRVKRWIDLYNTLTKS